jgi:uncharacterized protein (DUF697 family)
MNTAEKESILTLALMAGFADGVKNDAERAEFKRIADSLVPDGGQPAALYQRVLLKQVTLPQAAAALESPELRQLAYEMAVCVCDADGAQTDAEKEFLADLHRELQLDPAATAPFERSAAALAVAPLAGTILASNAARPAAEAEVDRMILNYAILNGALELMPESLATMAIIPLQMKLVYRIGKHHGHELDRGHIKELLAAAGVGLTSQVLEGYARKLLGGLLGRIGGGMVKSVGKQVTSSAMSFATTWALGKLANQYYAAGRKLSAGELRSLFGSLTEQAQGFHANHVNAIRDKAGSLNLSQILPLVRGQ